jgi:hypothetical protein
MGKTTRELTPESARAQHGRTAVILPWMEYESAVQALVEAGFQTEDIVCWNEYFARTMVADPNWQKKLPALEPRVGFAAPTPESHASSGWPRAQPAE